MMYVVKISDNRNHWVFFNTYEAACRILTPNGPRPELNLAYSYAY